MTNVRIVIKRGDVAPPVKKYIGYRVLHKIEGGWQNTPIGMPEVMPPINAIAVAMTRAVQWMSYTLFLAMNPILQALVKTDENYVKKLWTNVHDGDRAFTNYQGFDMPGNPRANFITGAYVEANENPIVELPKYDKCQRVCGGSFIRGTTAYSLMQSVWDGIALAKEFITNPRESFGIIGAMGISGYLAGAKEFLQSDNVLRCYAGVHGIDASASVMPETSTIIGNNWYICAVSMDAPDKISHFPQGKGGIVAIPFIIPGSYIEFPIIHLERWESDQLPDPLKIYARNT